MDERRRTLIAATLTTLIADAEAELARAEREHAEAMALEIDADDPEDAAYVAETRAETGAEVYAAKAVADALESARHELLHGESAA